MLAPEPHPFRDGSCQYRSFEEWLQKINRGNVLSFLGDRVSKFFVENSIPDGDRDALLEKYGLSLEDRMRYGYGEG